MGTVTIPMPCDNSPAPKGNEIPKESDKEEISQDTKSTDIEDPKINRTSSARSNRMRLSKTEQAKRFFAPIANSFEAFYQNQKALQPNGRSTPKRPRSKGKQDSKPPSAKSIKSKSKRIEVASKDVEEKKDMDLDSVLDFDTKRTGEPDGAESGVVMDMEGSLPVFSDSGDLTPEPTRVTPHGQINRSKKPKATPRGVAL